MRLPLVVVVVVALAALARSRHLATGHSVHSSGPSPVTVYERGEEGYFCVKIPSLLYLQSGAILAFGEARKFSCADTAWTDLVVKRSADNGTTWSALQVVHSNSTNSSVTQVGNAAPLQLRHGDAAGTIVMPFCVNNSRVFLTKSTDDGLTWEPPRELDGLVHPSWNWIGLGPPGSIQLRSGRILTPAYHTFGIRWNGQFTHGHTVLSDDNGETWRLGATQYGRATHFSNEVQAVELRNGSILVNARAILTHRVQALSSDGGETFGDSWTVPELREPWDGCEGSLVINDARDTLFYTGPNTAGIYRTNLTLWASPQSDGSSWVAVRDVDPSNAGYSSMQFLYADQSAVAVLWEQQKNASVVMLPDRIVFQAFPLSELPLP
eukprot:INCI750.1.p1 GENE.INCI750.1~~INCI750.1.p1  ORF type:complete len:380 (+),score=49.90 INCI750.1:217-1356(+)